MDEIQHIREQRALSSVRALVDRVQRDDRLRRRVILWALVAFAPAAALLVGTLLRTTENERRLAEDHSRPCELASWAAQSGELERSLRESGMPNQQIQKKIELERPYLMANAKIECNSAARK